MPRLIDTIQIAADIVPVDLAAGANNGDFVSLKDFRRCLVLFFAEPGTAGEDPVLTFEQAQDVAGTGAKALNITEIYEKNGADLFAIGAFTRVVQTAAATYTNLTSGESQNLFAVEIEASQLDAKNGFDCFRMHVPDTGITAGKLGCALYLLYESRYQQEPMPTAITN